jgi:Fe-S-cluster containining protein
MGKEFYSKGLQFECTQCGHCCRHEPGYVFLSEKDVINLLSYLSISQDEFIKKYCRIVDVGFFRRVSLIEKPNNDCIFWQNGLGCSVYEARPLQCRSYPFWSAIVDSEESWQEESQSCPGMNHGKLYKEEEIQDWLKGRELDPPFDIDS